MLDPSVLVKMCFANFRSAISHRGLELKTCISKFFQNGCIGCEWVGKTVGWDGKGLGRSWSIWVWDGTGGPSRCKIRFLEKIVCCLHQDPFVPFVTPYSLPKLFKIPEFECLVDVDWNSEFGNQIRSKIKIPKV